MFFKIGNMMFDDEPKLIATTARIEKRKEGDGDSSKSEGIDYKE